MSQTETFSQMFARCEAAVTDETMTVEEASAEMAAWQQAQPVTMMAVDPNNSAMWRTGNFR